MAVEKIGNKVFGSEFTSERLTHSAWHCFIRTVVLWDAVPQCPARARTQIPSLLCLAPFSLRLEGAQGHWFFHTHLVASICLTQFPGLKGRTALVPNSGDPLLSTSCHKLPSRGLIPSLTLFISSVASR